MMYRTNAGVPHRSPMILWDNVLTTGEVTFTGLSVEPGINALTQSTYDAWTWGGAATATRFGDAVYCDTLGLAGHNLAGRSVTISHRNGGEPWVDYPAVTLGDNNVAMIAFPGATAEEWRVSFGTGSSAVLAVMFLGKSLVVPGVVQPPHVPLGLASDIEVVNGNVSRTGQFLTSEYRDFGGSAEINFQPLYGKTQIEPFRDFAQHYNRGGAFFIACAPADFPDDMGYCWREGRALEPAWRDAVFADVSLSVRVYRGYA